MARGTVFETVQLGVESTAGSAVSASKRIQGFELDCDPVIPTEVVESQGWKAPVDMMVQKEHTKASIKGILTFNEILYLLSSGLCTATISTPSYNGVWTVTISGTPTGGTFTLTFNGQTTAGIAYNAAASAVQSALEALSTIGSGNVAVTGSAGGPYTVTFQAALEATNVQLTASGAGLTGGSSPAVTPASTAASGARKWLFLPSVTGADTYKTFTFEKGSASGAGRFTYGLVTDLDLDFMQKGCDLKGEIVGQEFTDGITMTSSPTDIPIKAVSPKNLDVYLGTSVLGLTKTTRSSKASWGFKDRHRPRFTLDSAEPSYAETVESKFGLNAQLVVEQNTAADAYMTALRAGTVYYCRIVAKGGNIEPGYDRRIQITFPFQWKEVKRGDDDGVYAGTYDLTPINVSGFGGVVEVVVITDHTAL